MLMSNQRGRGHEPVMVQGRILLEVTVNIILQFDQLLLALGQPYDRNNFLQMKSRARILAVANRADCGNMDSNEDYGDT